MQTIESQPAESKSLPRGWPLSKWWMLLLVLTGCVGFFGLLAGAILRFLGAERVVIGIIGCVLFINWLTQESNDNPT